MKKGFGVFLQTGTPPALLSMFAGFLGEWEQVQFFSALSVEQVGAFLLLEVLPKDSTSTPCSIQIPLGYVLAIVDMSEDTHPPGFLRRP